MCLLRILQDKRTLTSLMSMKSKLPQFSSVWMCVRQISKAAMFETGVDCCKLLHGYSAEGIGWLAIASSSRATRAD
jgi:hypothetical protein